MVSNANYMKLKTNLSLSIQRLKLLEKKKTELAQKSRKEIADYISQGKAERAKIRVEHIIREDYMVEAMEIVEMYCDTLMARFGMIEQMKTLDEGIEEAVSSLIWVAPRMQSDVKELKVVHDILLMKYGKAFAQAARENQFKTVNEKLMIKLGVQAPPKILVERYLIEIAKTLNVDYEPDEQILREDELYRKGGGGGNVKVVMGQEVLPPPPGVGFPLIDLSLEQPAGTQMPPPLPSQPPSGPYPSGSAGSGGPTNPSNIGFNVVDQPAASSAEAKKAAMANEGPDSLNLPPALPGTQSVPPSYESVYGQAGEGAPGVARQPALPHIPDFDESHLPSVPNLPEIPDDDDDLFKPNKKNVGAPSGGGAPPPGANNNNKDDDIDFDDLRRRFDELKKKKY